jgi:hypothetical protein
MPRPLPDLAAGVLFLLASTTAATAAAATEASIEIRRIGDEIVVDGHLDEPAWTNATTVDKWYETRPGDNVEPKVKNRAYLAYDDRFLYAGFEFEDSHPDSIRAPLGNRDNVPSYTDYGGVIVDTNDDGRTAQMFLANARGIQYDALSSDAAGEDSSPDFFWDSAARISEDGWVLEIRIPFSSLRYTESDPERWGIMLFRNHPREFRYQMFTSRIERDSTCFICNVKPLTGLSGLPSGDHWVAAPYVNANQLAEPRDGPGTSLESGDARAELGFDAKWLPNPDTVLDLTLNPDFSQIESDVAQIGANERFALFFPEKRPFFLEGADLFSTPLRAVYTRTFTSPAWGARATGSLGGNSYTLLVGEDRGGGSTILPGPNSSDLVDQDFTSSVMIGRFRHDIGKSFLSTLFTAREIDGGGHNRVFGPDFRWQVTEHDVITGQLLFSNSHTPDRPDLADEWNGQKLSGHAAELWWYRQTKSWDYFTLYNDIGDDFRADNGFVPQVGFRRGYAEVGRSFYPEDKPVTRLRLFTSSQYSEDRYGNLLLREIVPGFGFDALWNSFVRVEFRFDEVLAVDQVFKRQRIRPTLLVRPGGIFSQLFLRATLGDEVDFANDRLGEGATLELGLNIRPTDHLELAIDTNRRWLDVVTEEGLARRLFTAEVQRLRATYTLNARSWVRLIGQWVGTDRDPRLYIDEVDARSRSFGGSAVFAYKLNWQTVLFVGYGDNRELDDLDRLEPADRQLFLKLSYAFQG